MIQEKSTCFLCFVTRNYRKLNCAEWVVDSLIYRRSVDSLRRRANARNVSFRISLRWTIHIINPVDKTISYLVILPPTQHHSFFRNLPPLSKRLVQFSVHNFCCKFLLGRFSYTGRRELPACGKRLIFCCVVFYKNYQLSSLPVLKPCCETIYKLHRFKFAHL